MTLLKKLIMQGKFQKNSTIITMDVSSLFTHVPFETGIKALRNALINTTFFFYWDFLSSPTINGTAEEGRGEDFFYSSLPVLSHEHSLCMWDKFNAFLIAQFVYPHWRITIRLIDDDDRTLMRQWQVALLSKPLKQRY